MLRKLLRLTLPIMLICGYCLIASISGCYRTRGTSKKQVVFDLSHREIFSPRSTSEMGYSSFSQTLVSAGYTTKENKSPLTDKVLKDTNLLILAGPMTEFTEEETRTVTEFVRGGGNLLVLIHISKPVISLTERFDIQPSIAILCDTANPVDKSPQDFYVSVLTNHPINSNIKKLAVFSTWGLRTREGGTASIVARTSEEAWADLNEDQVLNPGEPREGYGIIAVSNFGNSKVVICADDALLINKYASIADNKHLGENIIAWFTNDTIWSPTGKPVVPSPTPLWATS